MRDVLAKTQVYAMVWLALLCAGVWGLNLVSSPVSDDRSVTLVTIPQGVTADEIGAILDRAGLIRSKWVFVQTVGLRGASEQLKPGAYELSRSMSLLHIIDKLEHGHVAESWLTIPEGFTARQIAHFLSANSVADEREFATMALSEADEFNGVTPDSWRSLEGYLFPDTYRFTKGYGSRAVIRDMLRAFRSKVAEPFREEIAAYRLPGDGTAGSFTDNLAKVVTVASLIEREAKIPADREMIASVLYNRLRKGMPLQVDATVQYALGEHRSRLFYKDYETPSDYNTYLRPGLPPGPIANPGAASVRAALRPARSDYLYYVASTDGSHIFSRTLQEHNRAVAAVRKARRG